MLLKKFHNEYNSIEKKYKDNLDNIVKATFSENSSILIYDFDYKKNINEAFKDKEDEIFKRIFVRINDCPEWCQIMLSEIRHKQLEEEQIIKAEIKRKEMRKQKRLELTRKIFSFLYYKTRIIK